MTLFFVLVEKILPLYFLIFLGFIAGKKLHVDKESVGKILIYFLAPVIVFHGVYTTKLDLLTLSLPFVFFFICSAISLIFYKLLKRSWNDSTGNILGFAAGSGNAGYFGLPVAVSIFGEKAIGLMALSILGFILYENTVGFFIVARGHHAIGESIGKLVKLPSVYAFVIGIICNVLNVKTQGAYNDLVFYFRGSYTLLGMMLIGIGLSGVTRIYIDRKFIFWTFIARFLVWPAIIGTIIFLDGILFQIINKDIKNVMVLISVIPIAANTVTFASVLKTHPEKASIAVLLTTVFALFYIPLIISIVL